MVGGWFETPIQIQGGEGGRNGVAETSVTHLARGQLDQNEHKWHSTFHPVPSIGSNTGTDTKRRLLTAFKGIDTKVQTRYPPAC